MHPLVHHFLSNSGLSSYNTKHFLTKSRIASSNKGLDFRNFLKEKFELIVETIVSRDRKCSDLDLQYVTYLYIFDEYTDHKYAFVQALFHMYCKPYRWNLNVNYKYFITIII